MSKNGEILLLYLGQSVVIVTACVPFSLFMERRTSNNTENKTTIQAADSHQQ